MTLSTTAQSVEIVNFFYKKKDLLKLCMNFPEDND